MSKKHTTRNKFPTGGHTLNLHYYCHECDAWCQPALTRQMLPHIEATPGDKMAEYRAFLVCGHVERLGQTKLRNADGNQFDVLQGRWKPTEHPLVQVGTRWVDPTVIPYPHSPIGHYNPDLSSNITPSDEEVEAMEVVKPVVKEKLLTKGLEVV